MDNTDEIALVFVGEKSCRYDGIKPARQHQQRYEDGNHDHSDADQEGERSPIRLAHFVKSPIKPIKKPVDRSTEKPEHAASSTLSLWFSPQQEGGEGRSEGEGEKGRDRDGKGDCETKLFIYLTGSAGKEGDGDKHCHQHN